MNLTKDDLQAIKTVVDHTVDTRVKNIVDTAIDTRVKDIVDTSIAVAIDTQVKDIVDTALNTGVKTIVEDAIEGLARQTAAGFNEVHKELGELQERVGNVEDIVGRIELTQQAEVKRVDEHGLEIRRMKRKLSIA